MNHAGSYVPHNHCRDRCCLVRIVCNATAVASHRCRTAKSLGLPLSVLPLNGFHKKSVLAEDDDHHSGLPCSFDRPNHFYLPFTVLGLFGSSIGEPLPKHTERVVEDNAPLVHAIKRMVAPVDIFCLFCELPYLRLKGSTVGTKRYNLRFSRCFVCHPFVSPVTRFLPINMIVFFSSVKQIRRYFVRRRLSPSCAGMMGRTLEGIKSQSAW